MPTPTTVGGKAKGTTTSIASTKTPVLKDLPLVRKRDGGTNYVSWRDFTYIKLQQKYPSIYKEFMTEPVDLAGDALKDRMNQMFVMEPLLNSLFTIVPLLAYEAGLLEPDLNLRKRFWDEAVEDMQTARRINNIAIAGRNATTELERKAWVEDNAKKRNLRLAMGALLLSPEYISADCLITIKPTGGTRRRVITPHG
jgi:hypothetical protein